MAVLAAALARIMLMSGRASFCRPSSISASAFQRRTSLYFKMAQLFTLPKNARTFLKVGLVYCAISFMVVYCPYISGTRCQFLWEIKFGMYLNGFFGTPIV